MNPTASANGHSMEGELRAAVERLAAGVEPRRGPVTEMVRLHAPRRASSGMAVAELSIGFADGSSMQVIFKDLAPPVAPPSPLVGRGRGRAGDGSGEGDGKMGARGSAGGGSAGGGGTGGGGTGAGARKGAVEHRRRPSFLYDPRREIAAYRSVLSRGDIAAPRLLGAVEDEQRQRFWLFLEDVDGMPLSELKFEFWLDAARWLAGMHRQFEARADELLREPALLRYDEEYFRLWILRAAEYRPAFRPLMAPYQRVVERLSALPRTFVHGAFFASSVLMQNSPWGPLVRPVDWQMAGVGPGAIDLAALMADGWTGAQRGALLSAYYEVWSLGQHAALPIELFLEDVSFCQLHHAVQCAGWSEHCPPAAEGRDWEAEALRLAKKVALI